MNKATVRSQKSAVRGKKKIAFFRDSDRGFTLLELMISITLLTMVILIIGNVFPMRTLCYFQGRLILFCL
jgi:prepilin-type N-terminal cleavage/methylation domain-containing protein